MSGLMWVSRRRWRPMLVLLVMGRRGGGDVECVVRGGRERY